MHYLPRMVPVWSDAIQRHVLSVVRPMRCMTGDADVRCTHNLRTFPVWSNAICRW